MAQFNLNVDPEFEETLTRLMRLRGIKTKSGAIRWAVRCALEIEQERSTCCDFFGWIGLGKAAPENATPVFHSDDELWS